MSTNLYCLIVIFGVILISGCITTSAGGFLYSSNGISFVCPENWAIIDNESVVNDAYFVSCEKIGTVSSGLFIATWFNEKLNISELMGSAQASLEEELVINGIEYILSPQEQTFFKQNPALSVNFTYSSDIGIEFKGDITAFNCNNKSITLFFQGATGHLNENMPGFEKIRDSFKC